MALLKVTLDALVHRHRRLAVLLVPCLFIPSTGRTQDSAGSRPFRTVPAPTGPHPVGRTVWHWADTARPDLISAQAGDMRELMVTAWYPAARPSGLPADDISTQLYWPLSRAFEDVRSRSIPGAPFAPLAEPAPVIVLCPGRGTSVNLYSAIAEDLASHGYAVFGFDAPHTGFVRFPDGRAVEASNRFQISRELMLGPYEHVDAFFAEAESLGVADFTFVVSQIQGLNARDPTRRFVGRLQMNWMGAVGHSLGVRGCGGGMARDRRFRALAASDGVPPRAVRLGGMDQAILMFISGDMPPEALPNFHSLIPNRRNDVFLLSTPRAGHNGITDRPLLRPTNSEAAANGAWGTPIFREALRAFFDTYVMTTAVSFSIMPPDGVTIERYGRPK